MTRLDEARCAISWAMLFHGPIRWADFVSDEDRHAVYGTAFSPQGESSYSWGTWWMWRAFRRIGGAE